MLIASYLALMVYLLWIGSMIGEAAGSAIHNQDDNVTETSTDVNPIKLEFLSMIVQDLANEGLLRSQSRVLMVNNVEKNDEFTNSDSWNILEKNIDSITRSDLERKPPGVDQMYDFVFMRDFHSVLESIDRVLRVNGIMVIELREKPGDTKSFQKPQNYEIVYIRQFDLRFDFKIIAMRKRSMVNDQMIQKKRRSDLTSESKKAVALENLENVLLEPPRSNPGKSNTNTNTNTKKTQFLPDLMGDSLESYPRRLFIDFGGSDVGWFEKNYPTRNKNFEIYLVDTTTFDQTTTNDHGGEEIGVSEWLTKNVKEEEYVVMKAEAEVVEDLVKKRAIGLVDELFMECKHQGIKGLRSTRPYWECVTLYGMLKDEGVAVHQWWG